MTRDREWRDGRESAIPSVELNALIERAQDFLAAEIAKGSGAREHVVRKLRAELKRMGVLS